MGQFLRVFLPTLTKYSSSPRNSWVLLEFTQVNVTGHVRHNFMSKLLSKFVKLIFESRPTVSQQAHNVDNDVELTSMRRVDVESTSVRRHFDVMCPLGYFIDKKSTRL